MEEGLEASRALDGSMVVELIAPGTRGSKNLSIAEAKVEPGQTTHRHLHRRSEEVYYIVSGLGLIQVGGQQHVVHKGQAVLIHPGVEHCATCMGELPLRILCACSPPYSDDDTTLTEGQRV